MKFVGILFVMFSSAGGTEPVRKLFCTDLHTLCAGSSGAARSTGTAAVAHAQRQGRAACRTGFRHGY
jgi:hypothetical protein